jgi:hypothetical protein
MSEISNGRAELSASLHDAAVRDKLRREWEPRLRACTRLECIAR